MENRKLAMIAGLYANTNLDGEKGQRQKIIGELEDAFAEAIANVYDPPDDESDPFENEFFKSMKVESGITANEVAAQEKAARNQPWIPTNLEEDL